MNKLFTIITIILSISLVNAFADSNGIWHKAEDVRSGTFALDEDQGNFKFPQNLEINNNLSIGSNLFVSGNPIYNSYIIGNFGIGTSSPSNKLSVQTYTGNSIIGISSNSQYSAIDFYNNAINKWGIGKDNLDNFYIDEFGIANRVIIKQGTGFMGLGTYDPRAELEVKGDIIAKNLRLDNGSGPIDLDDIYVNEGQLNSITSPMIVDGTIIGADINPNFYLLKRKSVSYSGINNLIYSEDSQTQYVIGSNQGVDGGLSRVKLVVFGDDTDNAQPLHLKNKGHTIGFSPYTSAGGFNPLTQTGDKVIQFSNGLKNTGNLAIVPWSDTQGGIRITNTGNVGIGIPNPAVRLHVNGNILGTRMGINTNAPLDYPLIVERTNTDKANIHLIGNNQGGAPAMGRPEISFEEKSTRSDWNVFVAGINGDAEHASFNINLQELGGTILHKNYFTILTNGNIGIGEIKNPSARLHINGNLRVDGDILHTGSISAISDSRLKKNIQAYNQNGINIINKITPIYYTLNNSTNNDRQIGFIAQEVQKVIPEIVKENENGYLSIDYTRLSVIAIKAIKEQEAEIKLLKQKQIEFEQLKKRIEFLENKLNK